MIRDAAAGESGCTRMLSALGRLAGGQVNGEVRCPCVPFGVLPESGVQVPSDTNRWPVDSPESAIRIRPGCGGSLQVRARRPSRPLSRSVLPQRVAAAAAGQRLAEVGPAMSRRARRRRRPSAGQPACQVKSPTASRGAGIGENCDPEEGGGIFGAMTTPARMTVGRSYATEQAGPGEFSRLPVTRVQSLGQHRARHAVRPP